MLYHGVRFETIYSAFMLKAALTKPSQVNFLGIQQTKKVTSFNLLKSSLCSVYDLSNSVYSFSH